MPLVPICTTNIAKTAATRRTPGSNRTSIILQSEDTDDITTDLDNTSNDNLDGVDGVLNIMVNPQCNGGVDDAKLQHLLDVLENLNTDVPEESSNKLNEDDGGVSHAGMDVDMGPGRFDSMEKLFLAAAEKGDKKAILYALENAPDLNINCTDNEGRSALVIAIQNGNSDIIKVLLDHSIQLGDALLRAVDEQFIIAAQMISDYIKAKNIPEFLNCRALNGDFHPDITPIVLAAHHNNYDIIKVLLEHGARIEDPEYYAFSTQTHTLQHSLGMLNIYRALASQAYISLTSSDPIHTAFERCVKLRKLSEKNPEFSEQFVELAGQCEQFAADILGHIRNHKEQTCVLYHDPYMWGAMEEGEGIGPYKVKIAIHYEQRKFVAHPHCQQRLTQLWYEGLPRWYNSNWVSGWIFTGLVSCFYPIISLLYILYPLGKVGHFMRIPHVQFVCHASSCIIFLLLLGLQSQGEASNVPKEADGNETQTYVDYRGKPPTFTEWLVVAWVLGLTWAEVKELWYYGSRYLKDRWNILDFITLSLYWASIALRIVVYVQFQNKQVEPSEATTPSPNFTTTTIFEPGPTTEHDYAVTSGDFSTPTPSDEDIDPNELILEALRKLSDKVDNMQMEQDQLESVLFHNISSLNDILESLDSSVDVLKAAASEEDSGGGGGGAPGGRRRRGQGGGEIDFGVKNITGHRINWDKYHPMLISEGLFAVAKVMSFLRPISLTVMNRHVGPMQISLGGMIFDISKFLLIFSFVWFAFSLGMNQLFWYYTKYMSQICHDQGSGQHCRPPFGSIPDTMATLFWALFGLPDLEILDLKGVNHVFTEFIGTALYAAYHVIAIVVLLNVLIAMMSNTYTRIEEDADIQWKFSRSKLWMSFFEGRGTVAVPFNCIPTPKTVWYIIKWFRDWMRGEKSRQKKQERSKAFMEERNRQYQEIMGKLVKRYIFDAKRDDEEGNQEQWVNRIKQDISGFKYEMFEALSGMDKKMADMESRIVNGELAADPIGTDMFHAMEEVVKKPPSRTDSMQSVKSEVSDACGAPTSNLKDSKSSCFSPLSVWDDGSMELPSKANRYKPKSPSMPCNIAEYQYPPEWERYQPILYIDEDPEVPLLGSPRNSISNCGSSFKRRRHSSSQFNHVNSFRKRSLRENTTKV
ncbi:LOW QUALITY PROTEIN: short transient receptor potential channel 4-like [Amphiura filiformis]|uniref:LOW QUALITY PROTEIN: short transient receptor potential channel 4-like n=1 Tax=Amphiura filiformis TaxID=82378 RepID=UPI003B2222FF